MTQGVDSSSTDWTRQRILYCSAGRLDTATLLCSQIFTLARVSGVALHRRRCLRRHGKQVRLWPVNPLTIIVDSQADERRRKISYGRFPSRRTHSVDSLPLPSLTFDLTPPSCSKPHNPPSAVSPSRHATMPNIENQEKWKEMHFVRDDRNQIKPWKEQRQLLRKGGGTKNNVAGLWSRRNACFAVCGAGSGRGVGDELSSISIMTALDAI